jgi:hypothetical protein
VLKVMSLTPSLVLAGSLSMPSKVSLSAVNSFFIFHRVSVHEKTREKN